eukprot:GILI01019940.1.p1 GENE.GILI01019940.1~~GILI01019940.1.p1  ORF type:complete len:247 (-),score=42.90 GILI01019940.1:100-750(-)
MSHPPNRARLIEWAGGEDKFKAVYSAVSLASFIPMSALYMRHASKMKHLFLHSQSTPRTLAAMAFKGAGIQMFAQNVANPSPASMDPRASTEPHGIIRVTRHPLFGSFALWGLGNVFLAPSLPAFVYWAGFPLFWYIGSMHQDYRQKPTKPASFYEKTSILPFAAIADGRQSLQATINELSPQAIGVALGLGLVLTGARVRYVSRLAAPAVKAAAK